MFQSLILAAIAAQQNAVPYSIIAYAVAAVLVAVFFAMGYCKAPPDKAFIISGLKKRVLIGKAGFRIPFFERLDQVTLELIQVDVKTKQKVPN